MKSHKMLIYLNKNINYKLVICYGLLGALFISPLALADPTPKECFGRLSFDLPKQFVWATSKDTVPMSRDSFFTEKVYQDKDSWIYRYIVKMMVTEPTSDRTKFTNQWRVYMPSDYEINEAKRIVNIWDEALEDEKKTYIKQQQEIKNGDYIPPAKIVTEEGIKDTERILKDKQDILYEMEHRKVPRIALDIEDAYVIAYSKAHAFVRRFDRNYMFSFSTSNLEDVWIKERPVTVNEVNQQLKAFMPRQLGEVPAQPGFCFPYGFLADDGKQPYEIKNSFRFSDAPNVVYTLYTGEVDLFNHSDLSSYGLPSTNDPYLMHPDKLALSRVDKTIDLQNGHQLTLNGWQVDEIDPININNFQRHYRVWGKIRGDMTQNDEPFIVVQINAFDRDEEDGRPDFAPPLDTAIERLLPILNSIKMNNNKLESLDKE